jgi:predicted ATP-grasp superfamily ATP-dependent carboligase
VLIEINSRFWDQHRLGAAVGVNLAQCLFLDFTKGHVPEQFQHPKPVTWIAEDGFFEAFLNNIKTRSYPISCFIRALQGHIALAVFEWRDWRPAVSLFTRLISDIVRRIRLRIVAAVLSCATWLRPAMSRRDKRN